MLARDTDTDRGVSPVIAVILMVAITVILSAVIGTFVLDIGSSLSESPPQATFEAEQSEIKVPADGEDAGATYPIVNITHVGGDPVDTSKVDVTVNGDPAYAGLIYWESGGTAVQRQTNHYALWSNPFQHVDEEITAGVETKIFGTTTKYDRDTVVDHDHGTGAGSNNPASQIYDESGGGEGLGMGVSSVYDNPENAQLQRGDMIRIVWEGSQGNAQILYEYEVK